MMFNRLTVMPAVVLALVIASSAGAEAFRIRPHLQNITPDGVTIIWETDVAVRGSVALGPAGGDKESYAGAAESQIHKIRIEKLTPASAYEYTVTAGDETLTNRFVTAPAGQRPITFVIFGDTRRWDNSDREAALVQHSLQWEPEFFVNMGDLVHDGSKYEQWPDHFGRFEHVLGERMMVTARGNHESGLVIRNGEGADWFSRYHDLPGEGEPYASFDWGNTHFAVISYQQFRDSGPWLDTHLATVDKDYVFVLQHYPIYCTGYYSATDNRKETGSTFSKVAGVLDKHRNDKMIINVSGHTHIYERLYPIRGGKRDDENGVPYIIQGGDIGANYPEVWTVLADDTATMDKPTYTLVQCQSDRIVFRTFVWSREDDAVMPIDHYVVWTDERVPGSVLESLPSLQGEALIAAIEDLGAMQYDPAVEPLLAYMEQGGPAVKRAAAKALRFIGDDDAARSLVKYLDDPDREVRRYAARALEIAMPGRLGGEAARHTLDPEQDPEVRVALVGALQFHAREKIARETALKLLAPHEPESVRRRAAYALGRVADKGDFSRLAQAFNDERDDYVLLRLAYTLNEVTGQRQSLDSKGPIARSQPRKRRDFIERWRKGVSRAASLTPDGSPSETTRWAFAK